jgi:TetR/AcrR family transcriptional repressor of nem operon
MRISKEAAEANKTRIVKAAGRMIREKGFEGLGVAEVMKEAGLTHGGFYNHFDSKEDLGAAAIREAFDAAIARLRARAMEASSEDEALKDYIARYLSEATRDNAGGSCPMAALGTDAAHYDGAMRAEFANGIERYLEAFASMFPAGDRGRESILSMATLVGALTLARACARTNEALSRRILTLAREHLMQNQAFDGR